MTAARGGESVRGRVEAIRAMVETARTMPMSSSVVMSRTELLQALSELQDALETEVSDATEIRSRRDEFVATGQVEAEHILDAARSKQQDLVSESAVFRQAERRAKEVRDSARAEADGLRRETDDYVDERLGTFEYTLRKTLEAVTRGRQTLHKRSELSDLGRDPDEPSPFSGPPPA